MAANVGLPVWNKAMIQLRTRRAASGFTSNTASAGEDTLLIIPFVLQNTEYVNAFITCLTNDSSSIKLFRAGEYAQAGFHHIADSVSADKIALQTMALEKNVFNHAEYRLLDDRLFNYTENGRTWHPEFCKVDSIFYNTTPSYVYNISVCYQITISGGWVEGGCPPGQNCNSLYTYEICDSYNIWVEGGGGGGTSSSCTTCVPWWVTNPGNGGNQGGIAIGWNYLNNAPPPPPYTPADTILDPCNLTLNMLATNTGFNSLMNEFKTYANDTTLNTEYGTLYNYTTTGLTQDPRDGVPGKKGIDFTVNYKISGFIHHHFKNSLSIFSPHDIWTICNLLLDDKMLDKASFTFPLVTAQGTSYMLMIDNLTKFRQFAQRIIAGNINVQEDIYSFTWKINEKNTNEINERQFLKYLKYTEGGSGLKLFRGNKFSNGWTAIGLDNNDNVIVLPLPCD